MYFKQILDEICGCASYLVASRQSREAAIVDPSSEVAQYEELLNERDFRLRYVIDTHVHADHISGARLLAAEHGAELCLYESTRVEYPFRPLSDGEELGLGQLRLKILHTPGHRPELISIVIRNPPRSDEPSMVLTGDSLLVGDVGRPDFGGGDPSAQYDSITRLMRLPDWVAVFPGHFEGPCGKGMCGRPSTTIGFERLFNPLARLERAPFVHGLGSQIPPRPLNMTAIEATNRGLADEPWAMLRTNARVEQVGPKALESLPSDASVLDVREPEEYDRERLPGAVSLPQADLASRLGELDRGRPVFLVCQTGRRSYRAAQFLAQVGFDRVANVEGGMEAIREAGLTLEQRDGPAGEPRIVESAWTHAGG